MTSLHVRSWPAALDRPLVELLDDHTGTAWLQGDRGLVGIGEAARLDVGAGDDRFRRAREWFGALVRDASVDDHVGVPGSGLVALASFGFDDRSHGSVVIVPEIVAGRFDNATFVTRIGVEPLAEDPPTLTPEAVSTDPVDRPRYAGSSLPDVSWLEAVATALERIETGQVDKVVLARDHGLWSKVAFSPRRLAGRLQGRFPGCYTFVVDGFVGATPELLVSRFGRDVASRVLAGSAPRGGDDNEDNALAAALLGSDKDRWEHELALRTVRDAIASYCESLDIEGEPHVLRLANVMHLGTWCRGVLPPDAPSALDLAADLHPTAAVGGVPTDVAVELIRELEHMDRGRYAGPVGWMDGSGDGEFGVALRCAQLSGARARLFAGAGIVEGSLPEDELEETRVKLLAMQSAFAP